MFLITSASFVEIQLRAEVGDVPPSFLPIGNRRLFEYQLELAERTSRQIVLSLPLGFVVPPQDAALLEAAGVRVLYPPPLSLSQSIGWCIRTMEHTGVVEILHGDTLFDELPPAESPPDAVSVVTAADHYDWAIVKRLDNGRLSISQQFGKGESSLEVLSGWFRFSSAERFMEAIASSSSFIASIERYSMECQVACVTPKNWRDVGHTSTYLRVRASHTKERSFNHLKSDTVSISKTGPRDKILCEAAWYLQLPTPLRIYTPAFLALKDDGETAEYELEYLYLMSLSDLYVFGALPGPIWRGIFIACEDALSSFRAYKPKDPLAHNPEELLLPKTITRLEMFAKQTGVDLRADWRINGQRTPSLLKVAEFAAAVVEPLPPTQVCWTHGDSCFRNVFFDFRSERLKFIDPRGADATGKPYPWGDPRYDLAKLAHSVYGAYDLIVCDRFTLIDESEHSLSLKLDYTPEMLAAKMAFLKTTFGAWQGDDITIQGIVVLLFLSMISLHADMPNRQRAFMANALGLYHFMKEGIDIR